MGDFLSRSILIIGLWLRVVCWWKNVVRCFWCFFVCGVKW